MTKTTNLAGILLTLFSLGLASCGHEATGPMSGTGSLSPSVELDTRVISSKASSRAGDAVTVSDLALTIKSKDGSYSKTWASVSDFPDDQQFKIGQYTVEASYGSIEEEGFEKPAYYGSTDVTVTENNTTTVSLTAELVNSMVSIDYTDAFKKYMEAWNSQVHSAGGDYISFIQDESRPAYIRPGEVTLNVSFTKPGASAPVSLQVGKFEALARHHYHITVDINSGSGEAVLAITFDEMLAQEKVDIELSDELLNAPAPTITSQGVNNGDVINHVAGTKNTNPIKLNIIAHGGLSAVTLTTQSKALVNRQGWPAEINLLSVDDATKARMQQLGLKGLGLWKNPEKMAVVDLTDVLSAIADNPDDNSTTFTISVTDILGKTSELFTLGVNLEPQQLELSNPSAIYIGQDELSLDMSYNGGNPKDVTLEYLNDRGTWTSANAAMGVRSRALETYRMKATVDGGNSAVKLRARTSAKTSDILTVERLVPAYSASASENDVWARKAYIHIASDVVSPSVLAGLATVYVSTGSGFTAVSASATSNGTIEVTGLQPATTYTVRVSLTGNAEQHAPEFSITTESPDNVPNAGFETLAQTLTENGMLQGGRWSISAGIYYDNKVTYTISEPTSWASVNNKTNSGSTRNTWFVQPSTFNSSLSYSSTVPNIKVFGTGGGTETPAAYKNFTPHGGANAMVLRNVGWNAKGSRPDDWKKEFAGQDEYYCHNVPDNASKSAGKLFLGSYSYSGSSETYNEGVSFGSRPAGLSFYYMYTPDSQDAAETGLVKVEVLNGTTVIASGSAKLSATLSYSPAAVALKYIANAPKATSIRVMFSSSSYTNESTIKLSTYNSRYESYFHGATLVIDDLNLTY